MITKQLTRRVIQMSEYSEVCTCHTFLLDGVKVLQAFKGFLFSSDPTYSRFDSAGSPSINISKNDFNAELDRIMKLD